MAYDDLRSLLRALEREGDLKRIKAEVDPYLEVGEIVDRVNKAGGPALLFENVKGSDMPLAMNVFGTDRRLLKALGLKSYSEISDKTPGRPCSGPPRPWARSAAGWRSAASGPGRP
ncbi:3-octaprenyl-4-hydroxybenzoate carboxy-lyase [Streptomyces tendae]